MSETILAGIDIGSSKIATIVGLTSTESPEIRIIGFNISPSRGVKKGLIVDIEQVTSAIGVAKGTFYYHFGSKDELIAEALFGEIERRVRPALEAFAHPGAAPEALLGVVQELLASHDLARDVRADVHEVGPDGFALEHLVERRRAEHLGGGDADQLGAGIAGELVQRHRVVDAWVGVVDDFKWRHGYLIFLIFCLLTAILFTIKFGFKLTKFQQSNNIVYMRFDIGNLFINNKLEVKESYVFSY